MFFLPFPVSYSISQGHTPHILFNTRDFTTSNLFIFLFTATHRPGSNRRQLARSPLTYFLQPSSQGFSKFVGVWLLVWNIHHCTSSTKTLTSIKQHGSRIVSEYGRDCTLKDRNFSSQELMLLSRYMDYNCTHCYRIERYCAHAYTGNATHTTSTLCVAFNLKNFRSAKFRRNILQLRTGMGNRK